MATRDSDQIPQQLEDLDFLEWLKTHLEQGPGKAEFMAPSVLEGYLKDTKRTKDLLRAITPPGKPAIDADAVRQDYSALFAILAICGKPGYIEFCTAYSSLSDKHLPFENKPQHLPDNVWLKLSEEQWRFCAPTFDGRPFRKLHQNTVLPFLSKDLIAQGGSADVFCVQIHPDFDKTSAQGGVQRSPTNTYALKTFHSADGRARRLYTAEVDAFRHFKSSLALRPENHIIAFHGSYEHGDTLNILLEHADHGTLENYFQNYHPPACGLDLVRFWKTLFGLLDAAETLHEIPRSEDLAETWNAPIFKGWHQDIKPANILVLSDPNDKDLVIFKLADFGLSHFLCSSESQRHTQLEDKDTGGTRGYGAPECYSGKLFHVTHHGVGQRTDIWSLGAVYSEAMIWSIGGRKRLREYRQAREEATQAIPDHCDPGCFHDKQSRLCCVDTFHNEALAETRRTDRITGGVANQILPYMLCNWKARQDARGLRIQADDVLWKAEVFQADNITTDTRLEPQNTTSLANRSLGAPSGRTATWPATINPEASRSLSTMPFPPPNGNRNTRPFDREDSDGSFEKYGNGGLQDGATELPRRSAEQRSIGRANGTRTSDSVNRKQLPTAAYKPALLPMVTLDEVQKSMKNDKPSVLQRFGSKTHEKLIKSLDAERHIHYNLKGRDHIFLVDDSKSMACHWLEVRELLHALAWIVSSYDDDGMELKLLRCQEQYRSKDPAQLARYLDEVIPAGDSDINKRLSEIFTDYRLRRESWLEYQKIQNRSSKRILRLLPGKGKGKPASDEPKPLSIYVLTDARWQRTSDALREIRPMVEHLKSWTRSNYLIGLQFIRFGSDPESVRKLNRLDSMRQSGLTMDIVDHEPSDGNLLKMVVGAIDKGADGDFDDDNSEAGIGTTTKDQLG